MADGAAQGAFDADAELVLRGVMCPINWVKAKIALEKLAAGQVLVIVVDAGEPARNVPRSAKLEGHTIVSEGATHDGGWRVAIRKKA